ncbi:MAG: diaminopimelate epimerase [Prevotellaceae bacterium]|nr:diaminopimelate epimerase [Prevotellaceae bacterium]
MKFTKMHGSGNDYIYINCFEEYPDNPSEMAIKWSDRHKGIGSDGLVLIMPSDTCDFRMRMFNSDGSEAQMCGNASRCVGKYVYDHNMTDKTELTLETLAGTKRLFLYPDCGKVGRVKVDMGEPVLKASEIPVSLPLDKVIHQTINLSDDACYRRSQADSRSYDSPQRLFAAAPRDSQQSAIDSQQLFITCVSMGNPHAVIFVDDVADFPVGFLGPMIEHHSLFPERTNVEFVQVLSPSHAGMRVWERGAGETQACGTGACAVLVAGVLNGLLSRKATVGLLGGDLEIEWAEDNHHVYMTGDAVSVFEGEI